MAHFFVAPVRFGFTHSTLVAYVALVGHFFADMARGVGRWCRVAVFTVPWATPRFPLPRALQLQQTQAPRRLPWTVALRSFARTC